MVFGKRDYERKFFSEETNLSFVRCFLEHAIRDPITGETGKSIFFAVSRKHATKLVTLLNEEATRLWPEAYGSGSAFAVQVTSDIPGAQQMTVDFANNNLNGKSKWKQDAFRDYETSRTRVCVTVGMMTTGYDCEDILNVVLARPIFSPTDFIQIKGRGTRLFTFGHGEGSTARAEKKAAFALFDFFANCEYFDEEFDYDKVLALPRTGKGEGGGDGDPIPAEFTNTAPDPLETLVQEIIGIDGMKIDREMYKEKFAEQASRVVAEDDLLRRAMEDEDWTAMEERVRRLLFEKKEDFWSLPRLQQAYKTDRLPSLKEILAVVFGLAPKVPTRGELAEAEFERFAATSEVNAVHSRELKIVFVAFLLDPKSRFLLEQEKFPDLRAKDPSLYGALEKLDPGERKALVGYLQSEVPLDAFEEVA